MSINITYLRQNAVTLACIGLSILLLTISVPSLMPTASISVMKNKDLRPMTETKAVVEQQLSKHHLFGEYVPNIINSKEIPTTLLNLNLVGILKASDPKYSQALIRVGTNDEKIYVINDKLPGGATLMRVLDHAVLIKSNGQIERLSLPKDKLDLKYSETPLHFED